GGRRVERGNRKGQMAGEEGEEADLEGNAQGVDEEGESQQRGANERGGGEQGEGPWGSAGALTDVLDKARGAAVHEGRRPPTCLQAAQEASSLWRQQPGSADTSSLPRTQPPPPAPR